MVRIRQRWSIAMLGIVLGLGLVACKKDAGTAGDKSGDVGRWRPSGDLVAAPGRLRGRVRDEHRADAAERAVEAVRRAQARGRRGPADDRRVQGKCGIDPMKMVSSVTVGVRGPQRHKPSAVVSRPRPRQGEAPRLPRQEQGRHRQERRRDHARRRRRPVQGASRSQPVAVHVHQRLHRRRRVGPRPHGRRQGHRVGWLVAQERRDVPRHVQEGEVHRLDLGRSPAAR